MINLYYNRQKGVFMKISRLLSIFLIITLLISTLAACTAPQSKDTDPEPTPPTPEYEYESKFVSFTSQASDSISSQEINKNYTVAGRFTFRGGYLEQVNAMLQIMGDVSFALYRWQTDYETTLSGEPIKERIYTVEDLALYESSLLYNMELKFEAEEVGEGSYLYVISSIDGSKNNPKVYTGKAWTTKTLPEEYEEYKLSTYVNGEYAPSVAVQSSFVFAKKHERAETDELPFPTDKDAEGTAKVILIGGQSNAEGVSHVSALPTRFGQEKYEEYLEGYSNVKIMYDNVWGETSSDGFVTAKAGQGTTAEHFGPELGIAEYLAKNFPNESFYIIKYSKGGSIMDTEWYSAKNSRPLALLDSFCSFVDTGLELIEAEGYEPKIIGFVWNQGESDASPHSRASRYYDNTAGMVSYVREYFKEYESARGIAFIDAAILGSVWSAYRHINIQKEAFSKTSAINFYIETYNYDIKTLEDTDDVAHYGARGMILLGHLYGEHLGKMIS